MAETLPAGRCPAVALVNPKFGHNVGAVVRAASCYGVPQVWFTGDRVSVDPKDYPTGKKGKFRLPREERMKGYKKVTLLRDDLFFDRFAKPVVPVCVEIKPGSVPLTDLHHPENALYVFGPEDGSVPSAYYRHCHVFVHIPAAHCLNLAAAVYTVLYDRIAKRYARGEQGLPALDEDRGLPGPDDAGFDLPAAAGV